MFSITSSFSFGVGAFFIWVCFFGVFFEEVWGLQLHLFTLGKKTTK